MITFILHNYRRPLTYNIVALQKTNNTYGNKILHKIQFIGEVDIVSNTKECFYKALSQSKPCFSSIQLRSVQWHNNISNQSK